MFKKPVYQTWVSLVIMTALFMSCAYSLQKASSKYNPADYSPFDKSGTASISGEILIGIGPILTKDYSTYLPPRESDKKTMDEKMRQSDLQYTPSTKIDSEHGHGCIVVLHPVTKYSEGWFSGIFLRKSKHPLPPYERQLDSRFSKTCIADNQGRFKFESLSPGRYLLFTVLPNGDPCWTRVEVSEGTSKHTILYRQISHKP